MENREPDLSRFADLLADAETAFLTDTSYAVAIAEDARQSLDRRRSYDDPDAVRADAVRLRDQGAGISEIKRVLHTSRETILAAVKDTPQKPQEASQRPQRDSRELPPEPRPVIPSKKLKAWTPAPLAEDDPRHGTANGYRNYSCRCSRCGNAHREDKKRRRAEGPKGTRAAKAEHGTRSKYSRGCRCDECKAAATSSTQQERAEEAK